MFRRLKSLLQSSELGMRWFPIPQRDFSTETFQLPEEYLTLIVVKDSNEILPITMEA